MNISPKAPGAPPGAKAISVPRPVLDAGVDEFLLKGGDQH